CVRPERIGVAPERRLMIGASAERNDDNGGCKRTDLFLKTPARGQFGDQPYKGDDDADERQIGVAIGMSLPAHLHDPNYWDQHANKPKPAREKKRESFSENDHNCRQSNQERSTTGYHSEREEGFLMRIKDREIDRPDYLTQI